MQQFPPRAPKNCARDTDLLNPYTYTGRRLDDETGLYYYRHRYYHGELGRFVGRDPIGYQRGILDLYQYVSGRPAVGADPFGLCTRCTCCCVQKIWIQNIKNTTTQLGLLMSAHTSFEIGALVKYVPVKGAAKGGNCVFEWWETSNNAPKLPWTNQLVANPDSPVFDDLHRHEKQRDGTWGAGGNCRFDTGGSDVIIFGDDSGYWGL